MHQPPTLPPALTSWFATLWSEQQHHPPTICVGWLENCYALKAAAAASDIWKERKSQVDPVTDWHSYGIPDAGMNFIMNEGVVQYNAIYMQCMWLVLIKF